MRRVSSPPSPSPPLRRSVASSPSISLRRYVAPSLRRFVASPSPSSLFSPRYAHNVALRKNCTHQTNPFASPTSIPVFRPAPHAFVKHGRMDKEGGRWPALSQRGLSIRSRRQAPRAIDPAPKSNRSFWFKEAGSLDGSEHARHEDANGIMRPLQRFSGRVVQPSAPVRALAFTIVICIQPC